MKKIVERCYLGIICVFLYAPIFTLMVLSFNESKSMAKWGGFSLRWYQEMFQDEAIREAIWNTLAIALISAVVATLLGTLACIGIQKMKSSSRAVIMMLNNIPMVNSDIVTGISLMLIFVAFGISLNRNTVLIAHITFCIPYVMLSVLPKMKQAGKTTYEAALDLGATPIQAFIKVVLPEIRPGIVSGFLMAFTMSVDDFIITHFTRGAGVNTLSTLIYSQVKVGIRPSIYALSTVMFATVLILLIVANFLPGYREKRTKKAGG
jgi:spermidine/putrescine transport system permease protein